MLDTLRKHASSWLIKVILGAIIVTFIFFFGYSSYQKGARGSRIGAGGDVAANVNGIDISASEFKFFLDQSLERMKASFKDSALPEFAQKLAESSTMQQLINREIALQQADELGILITDNELADVIKKANSAKDGEFDPIAYRHNFLPYFKNRFGMDYESLVRQDLRLASLAETFETVNKTPPFTNDDAAYTFWTFEAVTLEQKDKETADKLVSSDTKNWKKMLAPLKVEVTTLAPVTIANRKSLLDGKGENEHYEKVFSLSNEGEVLSETIQIDDKLYVVRLVKKEVKTPDEANQNSPDNFLQSWMAKLTSKAKIKNFITSTK